MRAVILGGTGTLGKALTRALLERGDSVLCFSRSELSQKQMASEFGNHPGLTFRIGDIRDSTSVLAAIHGADTVFHCAALKHVDVCEENPEESVKTNILGTIVVADAAIQEKVPVVVFCSTDKAVSPINCYGMAKGVSEKILLRRNQIQDHTKFVVYRWGNVLSSRGSVIPVFVQALKESKPLGITDRNMTRFWIRIEDAVKFMLETHASADGNSVMIPPIKAASVLRVVEALAEITGNQNPEIRDIPIRPGEKLHESLSEGLDSLTGPQYTPAELTELLKEHA